MAKKPETPLIDNIRDAFGRVVYTHKTHEKIADRLSFWLNVMKIGDIAIKALTAVGTIAVIFGSDVAKIISAILASISLFTTLYLLKFSEAQEHHIEVHCQCAAKLWAIREKYAALISDIVSNSIDPSSAIKQRDALIQELEKIYEAAPRTDSIAYNAARKALKIHEEMTFSDQEIDAFLPASLRKSRAQQASNGK